MKNTHEDAGLAITPDRAPVVIYTDGACLGNPGPGGWAYIAVTLTGGTRSERRQHSGAEPKTTNNRMEMAAAIEALRSMPANAETPLVIVSDSKNLILGMTEWIHSWKSRGWRKSDGKPVLNSDLWKQLDVLTWERCVQWLWTPGHAENDLNNEVDRLASAAARMAG